MSSVITLARLELTNIFGINVMRHIKDKKEKKKKTILSIVVIFVIVMAACYTGGSSYAFIHLEMGNLVPAYLTVLSSVFILLFGIFKCGSVLFRKKDYDIITSMPVSKTDIVISRYIYMYIENIILTAVIVLPGIVVYGVMVKPAATFYLFGLTGLLFIPFIPMAIATFISAAIIAIASRTKNKTFWASVFTIVLMAGVFMMSLNGGNIDITDTELLKKMSGLLYDKFKQLYVPSVWLGDAMTKGEGMKWLVFLGASVAILAVVVAVVAATFHNICRNLFGTTAKHNYKMQQLEQRSVMGTLCIRELKRYFSSSIYVTNTIVGPAISAVCSIALFVAGASAVTGVTKNIPISINVNAAIPLVFSAMFCMMNMASVSISMEGKNWWIVKSMPIDTKEILGGKMLAALVVLMPFYVVTEIFLILALKPSFMEFMWIVLALAFAILFCTVFGITVNLQFPVFNWENDTSVVKQSAASTIGGLGGGLVIIIMMIIVAVVPKDYLLIAKGVCLVALAAATIILYTNNNRKNLLEYT